jgi:hypothetical protein
MKRVWRHEYLGKRNKKKDRSDSRDFQRKFRKKYKQLQGQGI